MITITQSLNHRIKKSSNRLIKQELFKKNAEGSCQSNNRYSHFYILKDIK